MAQHGYLGDDYGSGFDPNYDDDRERDRDRERGWRGDRDRDWRSDRGMTFGEGRDRGRSWDEDNDDSRDHRGPLARWGEEARSWFQDKPDGEPGRLGSRDDDRLTGDRSRGSDAREWFGGRRHDSAWENNRDWPNRDRGMTRSGGERRFGSSQDDHYRSWRDSQMEALDRDYQDYCREREQRFHQDFDSWRQNRSQGSQGGGRTEIEAVAARRFDPTGGTSTDAPEEPQATVDTDSAATLGTQGKTGASRTRRV